MFYNVRKKSCLRWSIFAVFGMDGMIRQDEICICAPKREKCRRRSIPLVSKFELTDKTGQMVFTKSKSDIYIFACGSPHKISAKMAKVAQLC